MSCRLSRAQSGFTIMELITVLAIVALLSSLAIPSAEMSKKRKLDLLQLQMQDALDHAASLAYHNGAKYGVIFNVPGQYIAIADESITPVEDPLTHSTYIIKVDGPDQPSGLRLEHSVFGFRPVAPFDDKGNMTKPGVLRISADGQERLLHVDTATARLVEVPMGET